MRADDSLEAAAEALDKLADLYREGAVYLGYRPQGANDEHRYISLLFKIPKRAAHPAES